MKRENLKFIFEVKKYEEISLGYKVYKIGLAAYLGIVMNHIQGSPKSFKIIATKNSLKDF